MLCMTLGFTGCGRDVSSQAERKPAEEITQEETTTGETIRINLWNKDSFDKLYSMIGSDSVNDSYQISLSNIEGSQFYFVTENIYNQIKSVSEQFGDMYHFDIVTKEPDAETIEKQKNNYLDDLAGVILLDDSLQNSSFEDSEVYQSGLFERLGTTKESIKNLENAEFNWLIIDKLGPIYKDEFDTEIQKILDPKKTLEEKKTYFESLKLNDFSSTIQSIESADVYDKDGNCIGTIPGDDIAKLIEDKDKMYSEATVIAQKSYGDVLKTSDLEFDKVYKYELKCESDTADELIVDGGTEYHYYYPIVNDRTDSYIIKTEEDNNQFNKAIFSVTAKEHNTAIDCKESFSVLDVEDNSKFVYITLKKYTNDKALLETLKDSKIVYTSAIPEDGDVFKYDYLYNNTANNFIVYVDDKMVNIPKDCGLNLFDISEIALYSGNENDNINTNESENNSILNKFKGLF